MDLHRTMHQHSQNYRFQRFINFITWGYKLQQRKIGKIITKRDLKYEFDKLRNKKLFENFGNDSNLTQN